MINIIPSERKYATKIMEGREWAEGLKARYGCATLNANILDYLEDAYSLDLRSGENIPTKDPAHTLLGHTGFRLGCFYIQKLIGIPQVVVTVRKTGEKLDLYLTDLGMLDQKSNVYLDRIKLNYYIGPIAKTEPDEDQVRDAYQLLSADMLILEFQLLIETPPDALTQNLPVYNKPQYRRSVRRFAIDNLGVTEHDLNSMLTSVSRLMRRGQDHYSQIIELRPNPEGKGNLEETSEEKSRTNFIILPDSEESAVLDLIITRAVKRGTNATLANIDTNPINVVKHKVWELKYAGEDGDLSASKV
jgi:hypothetical protein